jgi:hypothetical protein
VSLPYLDHYRGGAFVLVRTLVVRRRAHVLGHLVAYRVLARRSLDAQGTSR